jgi:NitT/TauT family transport system substrate-binding protein
MRQNKLTAVLSWSVCVFPILAVVGALGWWAAHRSGKNSAPLEHIILAVEPVPPASPVWIAQHNGYFQEEGVAVETREFESGRTALFTMLEQGGIDIATAAQTPVISKSFGRTDYAIIGGMMTSDQDVKFLARRDRGIDSPADLKGKTIGVTSGSSGHFFLGLFLAYYQLQLPDVKIRDLEPAELGDALVAGEVDAVATWEPHIYRARKALGQQAVLLPSRNIYREDFYFIARKEFIAHHSEALRRFLRAIDKAEQFVHQNRAETLVIIQNRLKVDPAILAATWDEFQFELSLDESILVSLEDEARWAIENKLTESNTVPNYLSFIHTDALLAVKPEAVTIPGRKR